MRPQLGVKQRMSQLQERHQAALDAAETESAPGNIVQTLVERTFAWISRNRRLARDFERYAMTVAAFVRLAMIRIMLRRLAANASS
jgi:putative transposase